MAEPEDRADLGAALGVGGGAAFILFNVALVTTHFELLGAALLAAVGIPLLWRIRHNEATIRRRRSRAVGRAAAHHGLRATINPLCVDLTPTEPASPDGREPHWWNSHAAMHDQISAAHRFSGCGLEGECLRVPVGDWPDDARAIGLRLAEYATVAHWLAAAAAPRRAWLVAIALGRHSEPVRAAEALARLLEIEPDGADTATVRAALLHHADPARRVAAAWITLHADTLRWALNTGQGLDTLTAQHATAFAAAAVQCGVTTPAALAHHPHHALRRAALVGWPHVLDDDTLLAHGDRADFATLRLIFQEARSRSPVFSVTIARRVLTWRPNPTLERRGDWDAVIGARLDASDEPRATAMAVLGEHGLPDDIRLLSAQRHGESGAHARAARQRIMERLGLDTGGGQLSMSAAGDGGELTVVAEPGTLAVTEHAGDRAPRARADRLRARGDAEPIAPSGLDEER